LAHGPEAEVLYCHEYAEAFDAVTANVAEPPVLHTEALAGAAVTLGD
jgi:hypothetical protein